MYKIASDYDSPEAKALEEKTGGYNSFPPGWGRTVERISHTPPTGEPCPDCARRVRPVWRAIGIGPSRAPLRRHGLGEMRYLVPVVASAAELHAAVSGSGDPLSPGDRLVLAAGLQNRVSSWRLPSTSYDEAAKGLAVAALMEYTDRMAESDEDDVRRMFGPLEELDVVECELREGARLERRRP